MIKFSRHLFFLLFLFSTTFTFAQQFKMKIIDLHGEFLGNLKVNYAGNNIDIKQYGFGGNVTVGKKYLGFMLGYNYRKIDLNNIKVPNVKSVSITELFMGIRYFPMRPTIMIGKMAVRITAGVMYGFDMEPNWRGLIFTGLAFSPITSTSGLSVNFVYRPGTFPAKGYQLEPSWMIRLGLTLGPSL